MNSCSLYCEVMHNGKVTHYSDFTDLLYIVVLFVTSVRYDCCFMRFVLILIYFFVTISSCDVSYVPWR